MYEICICKYDINQQNHNFSSVKLQASNTQEYETSLKAF